MATERTFVMYEEHNEWEGEVWRWYIPIKNNETALFRLAEIIGLADCGAYYLDLRPLPESTVDARVTTPDDNAYRPAHTKLTGTLELPTLVTGSGANEALYKGRWITESGMTEVTPDARNLPRRFRSKPQEVEAIQWTGERVIPTEIVDFCGDKIKWSLVDGREVVHLLAGKDGAQGWVPLPDDHWIVRNPGDESHYWPVDPDYFRVKYHLAGDTADEVDDCIDSYERGEECDKPAAKDDEDLESLRETVEILSDPDAMTALGEAEAEIGDDTPAEERVHDLMGSLIDSVEKARAARRVRAEAETEIAGEDPDGD